MNNTSAVVDPRLLAKPKRLTSLVMMLIIVVGVMGSLFAGIAANVHNHDLIMARVRTAASALQPDDVKALKGNESDLKNPAYKRLKDRLAQIRLDNQGVRFVYLMGKQNGIVFFYVDSEAPDSTNYSPPGQVYYEASKRLQSSFNDSESFLEGPTRDRWGVWVSALAPVLDPATGSTIALVGMDTSAVDYYFQILIYTLIPLCLAAIPLAGLLRDRKLENKEREIAALKNQFTSIASHELRSPLAGMLWAIQSMLKDSDKNLTKVQKELLNDMYHSTEASLVTVNEILDLSVFERGQAGKMQHETLDLISVVNEVRATLKLGAQERKIKLSKVGDWPDHTYVVGDVSALKRALMNIVSNAIKYSRPETTIEFSYHQEDGKHIIAVRDWGIGIPKTEQAKVLEGYYRARNAVKVQAHGTGLGLWITKLIVEQHGGALWLESHENKGTTIFVSLPIHKPPSKHKPAPTDQPTAIAT
jgi:signal transduction histidine kinase